MAASKTYLEDPVFEDQAAQRAWLSAFYIFRDHHPRPVPTLRGAAPPEPRRDHPALPESSRSDLGVEALTRIVEQPAAAQCLGLPGPSRTARIDVLTVRAGVCVVFRAHHSVADGSAFAMFAKGVAEGTPPVATMDDERRAQIAFSSFSFSAPSSPMARGLEEVLGSFYFRLPDKGGPAQQELRHCSFRTPTKSRTYNISRAKCLKLIGEAPGLVRVAVYPPSWPRSAPPMR
ncbi:hypothetical protein PG994_013649 [Apiospora phragmitis]|uniref:Diacylglycerol O-acyltransferase n=1 Tax=Apiospora phragmitis TaxID=2905665 RepID=A0ABR1T994_9PEZI